MSATRTFGRVILGLLFIVALPAALAVANAAGPDVQRSVQPGQADPLPPAQPDCTDCDLDGFESTAFGGTDCNDSNAMVYPGATEVCDGFDQDCDMLIDEGFDVDMDTFTTCENDCDDGDDTIYLGAPEVVADGIDQDCDLVDTCYVDGDGDTYGTATTVVSLDLDCMDMGESTTSTDCDDMDMDVNPGIAELCNGVDDDCAMGIDDGFGTGVMCDGIGACGAGVVECATTATTRCSTDPGGTADDSSAEVCATLVDEDCDGFVDETAGAIRYVTMMGTDAGNACDMVGSPCLTIQHAIDVACLDDTIDIAVGLYTEDVSLYKRLTLDGAGIDVTTVTPFTAGSNAITVTASGLGMSPLTIKQLTVSGATAGANGIEVAAPGTNIDFDSVKASGNAIAGIAIDAGGAVSDVSVVSSVLSTNGLYGLLVTPSNVLTGLVLTGGSISDNGYNGVATVGDGTTTNVDDVTIDGTSFSGNGIPSMLGGEGDISLFLFNGDATIHDVDIVADGRIALQFRGRAPFAPAGTVVLDDVSISGSTSFSAISLLNYSSVAGISMSAVTEATTSPFGLYLEALGSSLDLVDTAFDGVHGVQRTIANVSAGAVDATGTSYASVDAATATLAELFAIEDQIGHSIDVPGGGLVRVRDLNVYVTPSSFATPFTTVPSIQRGVAAATPGDTVNVQDATYRENVVANKSVILKGQSQVATIVMPALSAPDPCPGSSLCGGAASNIVLVEADGVTIEHFTLDGDNDMVASGEVVFGADVDARNGIIQNFLDTDAPFDDTTVHHVTVKNVFLRGIQVSDGNGFAIHDNTVDNVRGDSASIAMFNFGASAGSFADNTVTACLDGIATNHSRGTTFTSNHVTCDPAMAGSGMTGIHTDNAGDGGGTADLLDGNDVTDCDYGMFVFVPYLTPTVSGNTIVRSDVGLGLFGGAFGVPSVNTIFSGNDVDGGAGGGSIGFVISTTSFFFHVADAIATFDDNAIQNYAVGIQVEEDAGDLTKSNTLTGSGNTLTLNETGVLVTASADSGTVTLDANRIFDNTTAGFTNDSVITASSMCTWWGTINGPLPEPMGGNPVTTPLSVDYMPWAANVALTDVDFWPDGDSDGFGDSMAAAVMQCGPPFAGYVMNNGDCNDIVGTINPDATEVCDAVDDDCDMSLNNAPAVDSCAAVSCSDKSCSMAGVCEYDGTCDIAGTVYYYREHVPDPGSEPSTKPVPDVTILRTSSIELDESDTTDAMGEFAVPASGGDVTLEPQDLAATEEECDAYISALDATRIAQHAVTLINLTTDQKKAGDVSNNGNVTSFDASLVAQKSVALPCLSFVFPVAAATGSDWGFDPVDKSYTPLTGMMENYDFLAILYGDVTGNWQEHLPMPSQAPPPVEPPSGETGSLSMVPTNYGRDDEAVIYLADLRRVGGHTQVTLGLEAADGIQGLDLSLVFDPAAVTITEVRTAALAAGFTLTANDLGGRRAVSLFSATPMAGTGEFLVITFDGSVNGLPFKVLAEANEGQIPLRIDLGIAEPAPAPGAAGTLGGAPGAKRLNLAGH